MSLDWSKEDSDVVAVFHFNDGVVMRYWKHNGELLCRMGEGEPIKSNHNTVKEAAIAEFSDFNNGVAHIRPEPTKPEWTIYNNEKPFGELSDEQKGLLLLANHDSGGIMLRVVLGGWSVRREPFWNNTSVYRAKQPEPSMTDKNETKNPKAMCINCEEPEVSNNLCACCGWLQEEGKYEVKL